MYPWGCLFLVPSKVFHCWKGLSMSWVLAHLNPFRKQFPASRGELPSRGRSLGIKGELFCNSLARTPPLLANEKWMNISPRFNRSKLDRRELQKKQTGTSAKLSNVKIIKVNGCSEE